MLQLKICLFFILAREKKKFSGSHCFKYVSLGGLSTIDQSMSAAIQGLNKVSLTKNIALPEQNIQTSIVATNSMDDGKKMVM